MVKHISWMCFLGTILVGSVAGMEDDLWEKVEEIEKRLDSIKMQLKSEDKNAEIELKSLNERMSDDFIDVRYYPVHSSKKLTGSREAAELSPQEQTDIVNYHNKLRAQEGASNMYKLNWNSKVASDARRWAQKCVFSHSTSEVSATAADYSQNLWITKEANYAVKDAVDDWYSHKDKFDYNTLQCSDRHCTRYTTVVWAGTTEIGCAINFCPSIRGVANAYFLVCNYVPPGNFEGEKPFLLGPPCTLCAGGKFFCNAGLCDSTCSVEGPNCQCKAACKNCATQTDCSCKCRAGYAGVDCSQPCQDFDARCGKTEAGWPQNLCKEVGWGFIIPKCPKLCGVCLPPDGTPCNAKGNKLSQLISLLNEEQY